MRIVEVNPFHYPFKGGIEHRIHHIGRRVAREHEVIVLTSRLPDTSEEEEIDGYRVIRLDSRFRGRYNPPYVTTPGVLAALEALEPDVVNLHYRWAPSYTKAVSRYRGPKVFTYHNTYGEGWGIVGLASRVNDWRFMGALRNFDQVIAVSGFVGDDLRSHGFKGPLTAISNGVELPSVPSRQEDGFMLFVGRLVPTKGLDHLIKAMALNDRNLVICGSGPGRERLERLVNRKGIDGRVEFRGRVSEEEKADLMARCDAFVLPSTFESYGIAAAEAMSYGKPVIATRVGGLPEVVRDAGILVPPADPSALAGAMELMMDDDEGRMAMARRARQLAETYDWDRVAEATIRVLSTVVGDYS